jgi:glycosyltransferase involved in cell wall biosynthesis
MAVRQLETDFDIVEIPDYLAEGLFISMTRRVPTVAFLHTPMRVIEQYADRLNRADRWLADRLERLAVSHSELVTSPTQRLVDVLPDGWLKGHVPMIIRLPIDLENWVETAPVVETGPVVAHIGRLEPRKAPETLVQAAAILADRISGFEVWFLGASGGRKNGKTYQEWLQVQSEELSSPSKFWGHVPREELPRHLDRIRVVAITSREDNFPMAGVEAMAAGRPIVCMSTVGLAEVLDGTGAGAIVPPDDPEALASALLPFLEDRQHAALAGQAARELVKRVCAADVIASHREAVYERAIAQASALR